ncbi:MAG: hypothetical protein HKN85_06895 [Gammaproteobacteria bacterium]|nr:hypothetical protein [Gammaproteobacteria bacterium]
MKRLPTTNMLKIIIAFVVLILLASCATTEQADKQLDSGFEQVNSNIATMQKTLSRQIANDCRRDNKKLVARLAEAVAAARPVATEEPVADQQPAAACNEGDNNKSADKLIIGSVEWIFLEKEKIGIDARIDTGAGSSSLGVYGLSRFERDGKKWVKFSLSPEKDAPKYRYPVYDTTRIKQESDEKAERRLEIKMSISLGDKKYRKQIFNLADRSHLEYQVLIGRNFLRDIAIVDVSHKHLLGGKN